MPYVLNWHCQIAPPRRPSHGERRESLQIDKVQQLRDRSLYVIIIFFPVEGVEKSKKVMSETTLHFGLRPEKFPVTKEANLS
jgi:hypothetical protein